MPHMRVERLANVLASSLFLFWTCDATARMPALQDQEGFVGWSHDVKEVRSAGQEQARGGSHAYAGSAC